MKVKASLLDMLETIKKLANERTGITESEYLSFFIKEKDVGQMSGYHQLQNQMSQQLQSSQAFLAALQSNQGNLGGLGGQALMQQMLNPYANTPEPIYPKIFQHTHQIPGIRDAFNPPPNRQTVWQKWAEHFGFKEDFDTGGFKHPNGGFVARRWLEDAEGTVNSIESIFKRALTPNMHWLDDRINEVRVRLI
jgi:hypothetical protein